MLDPNCRCCEMPNEAVTPSPTTTSGKPQTGHTPGEGAVIICAYCVQVSIVKDGAVVTPEPEVMREVMSSPQVRAMMAAMLNSASLMEQLAEVRDHG